MYLFMKASRVVLRRVWLRKELFAMKATPARQVTPTLTRLHGKLSPRLTIYPSWQTGQPAM